MNLTKKDNEDYVTFASIVNKYCDDFKLSELSADNFKCLIYVQGLVSTKDAEMSRRILTKLENEQDLTLQKLAKDCQRCVSVKKDSKDIEQADIAYIRKVRRQTNFPSLQTKQTNFPPLKNKPN